MRASELSKKGIEIKAIYERIKSDNEFGNFKCFFPHFIYVSNEIKLELIKNGFKVYEGEFMRGDLGLIIEW